MKNLNDTQNQQVVLNEETLRAELEFNDVVAYFEMSDQPAIRVNLLSQIHVQLSQIDEMLSRKNFMMKEIFSEIETKKN